MSLSWYDSPSVGGGSETGTVTSVGLSMPSDVFDVAGSPIIANGTLQASFKNQVPALFFASPVNYPVSPTGGQPSFRSIIYQDLPGTVTNQGNVFNTNGALVKLSNGSGTYPGLGGQDILNINMAHATGVLGVSNGGTSFASYNLGDLLVGNGSTALSTLPVGANGKPIVADSNQTLGVAYASTGLNIDSSYGTITTDADGSTITFDLNVSNKHQVTISGNRTLALSNGKNGQAFLISVVQGTGNNSVTWFNTIKWPGGTAPTLTATSGKADVFTFLQIANSSYYGFIAGQNL